VVVIGCDCGGSSGAEWEAGVGRRDLDRASAAALVATRVSLPFSLLFPFTPGSDSAGLGVPGADLLLRDSSSRGVADMLGRFMAWKAAGEASAPSFSCSPIYASAENMCASKIACRSCQRG
jgi:hypothetical protein